MLRRIPSLAAWAFGELPSRSAAGFAGFLFSVCTAEAGDPDGWAAAIDVTNVGARKTPARVRVAIDSHFRLRPRPDPFLANLVSFSKGPPFEARLAEHFGSEPGLLKASGESESWLTNNGPTLTSANWSD